MEPNWANAPPAESSLPHLPLERIKPNGETKVILTTQELLGVWTHFMGGRTLPCVAGSCPGCESQLPRRWEGYCAGITRQPTRHVIYALTPGAAIGIQDTAPNPAQLRGLLLTLQRTGKRANSRLRARVDQIELAQIKLPDEPDLKSHLIHIWGLDQSQTGQDCPGYSNRVKELTKQNGNPSNQPANH